MDKRWSCFHYQNHNIGTRSTHCNFGWENVNTVSSNLHMDEEKLNSLMVSFAYFSHTEASALN